MIDYNDIKQTIAENLPDNNRREITAARLRDTLDGFVDKVQVTEAGLEGKVSSNETNIGNLSGRMDTNEANVTNLTGRVDSLEQTVENLPGGGDTLKITDNPVFGGVNDVASVKWSNTISALTGEYAAESDAGDSNLKVNKVVVIDGSYINGNGEIVQLAGYSYFEYTLLYQNGYVTVPAYDYGNCVVREGDVMQPAFYDKNGNVIPTLFNPSDWHVVGQLELKVPYGATIIRVPLVNGTFDPNNVYVIESKQANIHDRLDDLCGVNEGKPTVDYLLKYTGTKNIDGRCRTSVFRLLAGDELMVCVNSVGTDVISCALSTDPDTLGSYKTIYAGSTGSDLWLYCIADRDCYAVASNAVRFKILRNNHFNTNTQYYLDALAGRLKPVRGIISLDNSGRGGYVEMGRGTYFVFKVPILPRTTLKYKIHCPYTPFFKWVAYWYSGLPVTTDGVHTQISFVDNSDNIITIDNTGSDDIGYALVCFEAGDYNLNMGDFAQIYLEKTT